MSALLTENPLLRVHDLEIDTEAGTVRRGGQPITLTRREYEVLVILAQRRGKVVTRAVIWQRLYGRVERTGSKVINSHIASLRNKIDCGFDLPLILTSLRQGYSLRGD